MVYQSRIDRQRRQTVGALGLIPGRSDARRRSERVDKGRSTRRLILVLRTPFGPSLPVHANRYRERSTVKDRMDNLGGPWCTLMALPAVSFGPQRIATQRCMSSKTELHEGTPDPLRTAWQYMGQSRRSHLPQHQASRPRETHQQRG